MRRFLLLFLPFCAATSAISQVSYTGGTYIQDFNTLQGAPNNTTGVAWVNNSTLPGWYSSLTTYGVTNGTMGGTAATFDNTSVAANAGLFSFGTSGSSDRALGSRASTGITNIFYGVRLVNNTGGNITAFNVIFTGEQWHKNGAATVHTLPLQYQIGASAITGGAWTAAATFNSPVNTTTIASLDGNVSANRRGVAARVSGISWAPGTELWLRIADGDQTGNEQSLGIDDFIFNTDGNSALFFDGATNHVTMGAATSTLGASIFTLEAWIFRTGNGTTTSTGTGGITAYPVVTKGRGEAETAGVNCNYFLGIDGSNRLVADFEAATAPGITTGQNYPVTGTSIIPFNQWTHLAVSYDGGATDGEKWKLYVNGIKDTSSATPGVNTAPNAVPEAISTQHFAIGTAMNSTGVREGTFLGIIDEVRVWNIARSGANILDDMDEEILDATGLLGRYGLNEGAGNTTANSVGLPNGTLVNGPVWLHGRSFAPNNPPVVTITAPADGASAMAPVTVSITATAEDTDGTVTKVEFFADETKIGQATSEPFQFNWLRTNSNTGTFTLTATATDNGGAMTTSEPVIVTITPNSNQPPVVTVTSPASNATGIGSNTSLNLNLDDPEGDAQTVTFFGRQTTPAAAGADFSLIAIPDTQFYSENANHNGGATAALFNAQTQWIVDNRTTRNIAFISHMGDIVEHGDNSGNPVEWVNADTAMRKIENPLTTLRAYGLPWGVAPGNHDQSPNGDAGGTTTFYNQFFGISRWAGRNYYGGHYGTTNNNNYELFSASGLDFIVLHLEYDVRALVNYQPVLDWANAVLQAWPNRRAIVMSHWIVNTGNPATFSTQGQNIYNALKGNPNLFLMLCGHVTGEGRRSDTFNGRTVYSILQDYQDITNGGNGFLRIYNFSPASNQITVESYSPTLGRAVQASDSVPSWTAAYTLPYNMQSSLTDWIPLGTVNVPAAGTSASLNWTGLEAGRDYEWYASVTDSISIVNTGASRFSTAANAAPTVAITFPASGASFTAPGAFNLTADATDADDGVTRVEFYQGNTKLGEDTAAPYERSVSGLPAGSYIFTAVAVDASGQATLSSVVNVTVEPSPPPIVALTSPGGGGGIEPSFDAPVTINLTANATDPDGHVTLVEFFNGATKIGEDSSAPYAFLWTNVISGTYSLTAKATDNSGASSTSAAVNIIVNNVDNEAPAVAITAPSSGLTFAAGSTLNITVNAGDTDGIISKVEFYEGANKLGEDTTAPFVFAWTSVTAGTYSLTAVARDNDDGTTTSPAVIVVSDASLWVYTQNFNGLGTGTTITPLGGWLFYGALGGSNTTWSNATGIPASAMGGGTLNNTLTAATTFTTSSNTAGFNFALPASPGDRALGTSPTSGQGVVLQLSLTNTTGAPLNSLRIGYDIRRFTAPATVNELPGYWLFYSLGGGTWTNISTINPTVTNVPNTVGVTTIPAASFALSSPWAPGATLLFRWVDDNAEQTSPDQIMGLDNLTISVPIGQPPTVTLTAPANGSVYYVGDTIHLTSTAGDSDGTITRVEFYQGGTLLGEDTSAPYAFDWSGFAPGNYSLSARATDSDGNVSASVPSSIIVYATPGSGTLTRGPYLQRTSPVQTTIRWRSSQSIAGRVRYGSSPEALTQIVDEAAPTTEHIVPITGLSASTIYYYDVGSALDTLVSGADYTFTTHPLPGTVQPIRMWALGDAGTNNASQTAVRNAFYTWTGARTPDFVLQLGDNAYNAGTDTEFQGAVFNMYSAMLRKTTFWSCLGNHETDQATAFVDSYPYFNVYTFPTAGECGGVASGTEHYYSFDYGNVHIISLDSMTASRSPAGAMAAWLQTDLASTTATWIICIFHHPPYTKGSHNSDTETELIQMRENINPILESGGVDLVLCGHSHCYERSFLLDGHYGLSTTLTSAMKVNPGDGRPAGTGAYIKPLTGPRDHFGTVYCVTGSAGQISGGSLNHPAHFISLNNLGSLVLDVNGSRLDATFLRENSTIPDTYTIFKQGAADTDHDGLPDEWEIANGLDRFNAADAAVDTDGDGLTNLQELLAGTAPNSPAGTPQVTGLAPQPDGSVILQLNTVTGKSYAVEANNSFPSGAWATVASPVAGTGGLVAVADPGAVGVANRVYRVTVLP